MLEDLLKGRALSFSGILPGLVHYLRVYLVVLTAPAWRLSSAALHSYVLLAKRFTGGSVFHSLEDMLNVDRFVVVVYAHYDVLRPLHARISFYLDRLGKRITDFRISDIVSSVVYVHGVIN